MSVQWLENRVRGSASWPKEVTMVNFGGHELFLLPATKDTEKSVYMKLRNISIADAMTLINRFLSVLSWCADQPMENLGGGASSGVPAFARRCPMASGPSISFPFGRKLESGTKARRALALFREARTVNSNAFEFLGYFKILNIFWKDKYDSKKTGLRVREWVIFT